MKRAGAYPLKNMERNGTERAYGYFNKTKEDEQRNSARPGQPSAGQAAKSQTQEKTGDHDSHRFHVDAENGEKSSLPNNLIDQRREARSKEYQNNHWIQKSFTKSVGLRQSTCHSVPLLHMFHDALT